MEARQTLCSPVLPQPLSLHLRGPTGDSAMASHVLSSANDKVAATTLMNYAGGKGSNSTLSYVNLTLRRQGEGVAWGEVVTPICVSLYR